MLLILYEDDRVEGLRPLTDVNPAFALWFGGERLVDRATSLGAVRSLVRTHLRLKSEEIGVPPADPAEIDGDVLFVNAAAPPQVADLLDLRQGEALVEGGRVVAARVGGGAAASVVEEYGVGTVNASLLASVESTRTSPIKTLRRPWEVCPGGLKELAAAVRRLAAGGDVESGDWADRIIGNPRDAMVSRGAEIEGRVSVDVREGPVLVGRGAVVGAGSTLRGPLLVGEGVRISPCSHISGSVLGREVRAGGEIFSSVMAPYSNKAHFGFLGHSYVGSWVNLGAGTVTSNLKNTYGEIKVDTGRGREATGLIKLGASLGDHVKTSIGTMVYTGLQVGAASQLHGFVTERVPPFTIYARTVGWGVVEVELDSVIRTYRKMAPRRGVDPSPGEEAALIGLFETTAAERAFASVVKRRLK